MVAMVAMVASAAASVLRVMVDPEATAAASEFLMLRMPFLWRLLSEQRDQREPLVLDWSAERVARAASRKQLFRGINGNKRRS